MTITAVAFDLGGVMTAPVAETVDAYGAECGLGPGILSGFFRGDGDFALVEVGTLPMREFLKRVCIRTETDHGVPIDIRRLAASAEAAARYNPDMLELVGDVHRRCATALVTNNAKEAPTWRADLPAGLFDMIIDSSEVGVRKPDPAIYRLLLERLGHRGEEVAFVDDFAENLPPAAALGITTILYTGAAGCRRALAALGTVEPVSSSVR